MAYKDGIMEEQEGEWRSFKRSTGARVAFGGILLLLNFGIVSLFVMGKFRNPDGGVASPWVALLPGLFLGIPALGLIFFRSGIRVDSGRGLIQRWWGFPNPWKIQEEPLSAFDHLEVSKVVKRQGNKTVVFYPVSLVGSERKFHLLNRADPLSARRLGERFAKTLNKPLHNLVSGERVIRKPEELDLSLGERIAASGRLPELPLQPKDSKVELEVDGENLRVQIPPTGLMRGGLSLVLLGLPSVFMGLGFLMIGGGRFPTIFLLVGGGIVFLPLLLVALWVASRGLRQEILEVGPKEVRLRSLYPWGESYRSLPTDQLEEVSQSLHGKQFNPLSGLLALGGISLTSDQAILECGSSLSQEDRTFVLDLVRYVLARNHAAKGGAQAPGESKSSPAQPV